GFKINDGDCPFYALLARKAAGKADPDPAPRDVPAGQGTVHEPLDLDTMAPAPAPARVEGHVPPRSEPAAACPAARAMPRAAVTARSPRPACSSGTVPWPPRRSSSCHRGRPSRSAGVSRSRFA
ncbi:MAG: hypothetical protein Q6353_003880, partial [Candidatus Sigynarchaeum springense]